MTFNSPAVTTEQRAAVCAFLSRPELEITKGVGRDTEHACTIAAINLALTGRLSDVCAACMSPVIHAWVIRVQDAMPAEIRNSAEWRSAACLIAGSTAGSEVEQKRMQLILDWMWGVLSDPDVLRAIPESARPAWDAMLQERTSDAADAAYAAADAARATAYAAVYAARATANAAADAARATAYAAVYAADAAADAARAADAAADAADAADVWFRSDPAGILRRLCEL